MAAEQPKTDTVMKFQLNGQDLNTECTLAVTRGDGLMLGFKAAGSGGSCNFFEVHDFEFGMSLKQQEDEKSQSDKNTSTTSKPASDLGAFALWRSANDSQYKDAVKHYPLEFDKFSLKRTVDCVSPIFFQNCLSSTTFNKATLVKRLSPGGGQPAAAFLRIDFTDVLLTGVDWTDGDLVSESIDFICKQLSIQLKTQNADGTLTPPNYINWNPTQKTR
jgi:type VI protein secretion system component Hcp